MRNRRSAQFRDLEFHLQLSAILILAVMGVGVIGYMVIEGWDLLDSLYMTVITLASVGYGETHPLDTPGRIFTIVLIVLGVASLGNVVSQFVRALSEGYFIEGLNERRRLRMLSRMENHFIICGYGRIGQQICKDLAAEGASFVIIEKDLELVRLAEEDGLLALHGDASSDEILVDAGIQRARSLLCALPSDAETLYVILSAKALNPKLFTIARVASEEGAAKLTRIGTDKVVSPYLTGAKRMSSLALRPHTMDVIEATTFGNEQVYIEEYLVRATGDFPFLGKTLAEIDIRNRTGAIVLALRRASGQFISGPPRETAIQAGDVILCLGTRTQLSALNQLLAPCLAEG